nr:RNA-dependent RNA polymerase [Erysiphe necator associated negative-stranded RNA virus 15]
MKREEFVSMFAQNRIYETYKKSFRDCTWELDIFRFNLPMKYYTERVTITPKYTYIPNKHIRRLIPMRIDQDTLMDYFTSDFEAEFLLTGELTYPFDYEGLRKKKVMDSSKLESERNNNFGSFVIETKPMWYIRSMLLSNPSNEVSNLRFMPLKDEIDVLRFYLEQFGSISTCGLKIDSSDSLDIMVKENTIFQQDISHYYRTVFVSTKNYEYKDRATLKSDFKSLLNEKLTDDLTFNKFDYWLRSRHDIFGELCLKELGVDTTEDMDVNMETRFNYLGPDFYKTPDFVLEDETKILILDFAVTTSSSGNVRERKINKYSELALGLQKHMSKEVVCDAIVWKINNMEDIQIPSEFSSSNLRESLLNSDTMEYLHNMHLQISLMDNYEKFRVMSEEEDLEENEDATVKLKMLESMNKSIVRMAPNLKFLKSKDFDTHRSRPRGAKVSFKTLDELKFKDELDTLSSLNPDYYINSAVDLLCMKVSKKDYPIHLEKVLNKDYNSIDKLIFDTWESQISIRSNFVKNINYKFPKLFKFPLFYENEESRNSMIYNLNPDYLSSEHETSDGTLYYRQTFDWYLQKREEVNKKSIPYNMIGIGSDYEVDSAMMDSVIEMLMEKSEGFNSDFLIGQREFMDESLKEFLSTNLWALVETISNLFLNLAYLEGRRHIFNSAKGHTVLKNFGSYYLMIKKGSKLTSQKAIRYKVIMHKSSIMSGSSEIFHGMKESESHYNYLESSWLSATITDIRHFVKLKEVSFAMASNYYDKLREMNRGTEMYHSLVNKTLMTYMVILMEHKRHTSTTLQLNRYLMHSATSYISNNESLIRDIFKSPTRTLVDSYIKCMQLKWYEVMMKKSDEFSYKRIANMNSTSNSYDRFSLPSMFDMSTELEFSLIMDEIYLGNLFDKEAGFDSHKVKPIVEKMEIEEMHFQKINSDKKKKKWSTGVVDDLNEFISSKDETHMFDRAFVTSASKKFFKSKVNKVKLQEALMGALRSTIEPAMMMTSSLVGGPYESECLEFSQNIKKTRSFLSLYNMIKKLSSHMLIEMANNMDKVDAVFAMFPKSQIGGPREILIQAVMLRVMVKFLETISKKFCGVHEKEMLTKDRAKAELQSDKMAEFREVIRTLSARDQSSLYFSLNTDASRWAPGFVMEHFMYFVNEWDVDSELKTMLQVIIASFSSKTMLVPEILKRKWENKDMSDRDFMEGVQSFREQAVENNYTVEVMSGMGQGMFHYLSSFYHSVMDDSIMDITKKVLLKQRNVVIKDVTMLSSDDKTRMVLMMFKNGPSDADQVLKEYVYLQDTLSRMCNIHFNWKKSGMNFAITEFNSLFSVGKRMTWASIKDIYTANSIPDLTAPEEAVNFMVSNIRRCLEHGVYLTTIKWLMEMSREQLKKYYRYDKTVVDNLMRMLNCSEDMLPFHLGFFPTTMEVETLIYGPEIHMYKMNNSPELELFYENMYKANQNTMSNRNKKSVPFSEDSKGKFWMELPSRLDKRLMEIKKDFYTNDLVEEPDNIMKMANKMAMNINVYKTDPKSNHEFTNNYFVGMNRKYEFQETMVVHSLIRALAMANKKARIYPLSLTEMNIVDQLKEKRNLLKGDKKSLMSKENIKLEIKNLEDEYDSLGTDAVDFTRRILMLNCMGESAKRLYNGLRNVVDNYSRMMVKLNTMSRSTNFLHPTMKAIRFYTCKVGSSTKPEDLINHVFDVSKNSSNSAAAMLEDLLDLAGYNRKYMSLIYSNPFKFVKKLMNHTEFSFKSFYDFIKLNYKSMKYVKITMLSDFVDAGNMEENILNVYRTKSTPNHYYRFTSYREKDDDHALEFLTNFSLGNYKFNRMDYDEASYITQKDNSVTRAMKLNYFNQIDNSANLDKDMNYSSCEELTCSRFDYKMWKNKGTNTKNYSWTNMNMIITACERDSKVVEVVAYANKSILDNNSCNYMMSMFSRFMAEKERDKWLIRFKTKGNYNSSYNVYYDMRKILYKTVVRYFSTKWTMSYIILVTKSRNLWDHSNLKVEFPLLIDNYTVENELFMNYELVNPMDEEEPLRIKNLIDDPLDIHSLDQVITKNGLLSDLNMVENEAPDDDVKYTIEAMNSSFGQEDVGEMLLRMSLKPGDKAFKSISGGIESEDDEIKSDSNSINLEDLFNEEGGLKGLKEALEMSSRTKESSAEEESFNWQRTSRIKILDRLISIAVKSQISVDKEELLSLYNKTRKFDKTSEFHNMLLFQIMDMLDFQVSDNMAIIIYNIVLKNYMPMTLVKPYSKLKKFSQDLRAKLSSSKRLIELKYSDDRMNMEEDLDLFS